LKKGPHQIVLVMEVAVEGRLRHPSFFDDDIDSNRPHSLPAEQVVGCVEDPFPRSAAKRLARPDAERKWRLSGGGPPAFRQDT
jgi:hypothetical protein